MERKEIIAMAALDGMDVTDSAPEGRHLFDQAWSQQSRYWASPLQRLVTVHDIAVLYLEGEVGFPEFHYLEELIYSLRDKGFTKFVFSFQAVEHLNYKVFQQLMGVAKWLRGFSGDLRFTQIGQYLYHIFLFAGADQTIEHFGNLEEAILSFHNTHGRHWH